MGVNRFGPGDYEYKKHKADLASINLKDVKSFYNDNLDKFPPAPKVVYRGLYASSFNANYKDVDKLCKNLNINFNTCKIGDVIQYKHLNLFPISTSASVVVSMDYAFNPAIFKIKGYKKAISIVLQFDINQNDIILDARKMLTDHPAQGEICLDANRGYTAKIFRLIKILNGKQL